MNDTTFRAEVSQGIAADVAQRKARYGERHAVVSVDIMGVYRDWEVTTDYAPAEPWNGYPGYHFIVSVRWNGVEIIEALTKEDREAIKEALP